MPCQDGAKRPAGASCIVGLETTEGTAALDGRRVQLSAGTLPLPDITQAVSASGARTASGVGRDGTAGTQTVSLGIEALLHAAEHPDLWASLTAIEDNTIGPTTFSNATTDVGVINVTSGGDAFTPGRIVLVSGMIGGSAAANYHPVKVVASTATTIELDPAAVTLTLETASDITVVAPRSYTPSADCGQSLSIETDVKGDGGQAYWVGGWRPMSASISTDTTADPPVVTVSFTGEGMTSDDTAGAGPAYFTGTVSPYVEEPPFATKATSDGTAGSAPGISEFLLGGVAQDLGADVILQSLSASIECPKAPRFGTSPEPSPLGFVEGDKPAGVGLALTFDATNATQPLLAALRDVTATSLQITLCNGVSFFVLDWPAFKWQTGAPQVDGEILRQAMTATAWPGYPSYQGFQLVPIPNAFNLI